ncbi:MAG: hypothetical protein E7D73_23175 [Klebsiella sp.]|uniref:hypothetical protein n=1 Tax=Klebsiella variicola TaxID=244366 RepID=UPI00290427E5|nr:hypothetical protein [Klebsiella sp.]MDU2306863.1 hypothetical protein [Klebsiella sp.]HCA9948958.1 hypothetical protein [Klebsiella variicola subsp. variicola]
MNGKSTMERDVFDVITDAEHAIDYTNQALAVLDLWLDSMGIEDDTEASRIAAVRSLVHESLTWLKKAAGINEE